jgi:hypothetical protein
MMRHRAHLAAMACAALLAGCSAETPVGEKASTDNKALQDSDEGFFSRIFGSRKPPEAPAIPGQCRFSAWAAATAKGGTVIRSGPGKQYEPVGTLPAARPTEAGLAGVEAATFDVVEAKFGWFRIENARYQRLDFDEAPVVYPSGWIPGQAISFALQSDYAFERPDPQSPVVASSWQDPAGTHQMLFENPQYCAGDWIMLTVAGYDGEKKLAWLRGACGSLETACETIPTDTAARPTDLASFAVPQATDAAEDEIRPPSSAAAGASARPRR